MNNIIFLYCFLLCVVYIFVTWNKVGLKGKSPILPSVFFSAGWALASLGVYLFSNRFIESSDNDYFASAPYLEEIGRYQFCILFVVFAASFCARFVTRHMKFGDINKYVNVNVSKVKTKLSCFLYLFFVLGTIRLIMVLRIVGFNYAFMREHYLDNRAMFGAFDEWLIRICSYLCVLSVFYVCLLGYEMALKGVNIKKVLITLLLFCPFQMSFGGRLFVLSFFIPFLISFFTAFRFSKFSKLKKGISYIKISCFLIIPIFLLIILEALKMGGSLEDAHDYMHEIFYPASSYIHMNELWGELPEYFDLGFGMNMIGFPSYIYTDILASWEVKYNSASVCTPSVIPQIYLDFGENLSYVVYFVLFFLMEWHSIKLMSSPTIPHLLLFVEYCFISFQTPIMSASDAIRTLIVAAIFIFIFAQLFSKRTKVVRKIGTTKKPVINKKVRRI